LRIDAPKQRALLALLLLHANEVVSSDRLVEELWSGEPPASARRPDANRARATGRADIEVLPRSAAVADAGLRVSRDVLVIAVMTPRASSVGGG